MDPDRKRRQQEAYDLQMWGATEGAVRWTLYGLIFTTTLHHTWPLFRRQTLAGKAFVVSGFTIFGLVTWADHYLIAYEREERQQNEMLRRAAQRSIASTGKVASEREIRSWMKDNKETYMRRMQDSANQGASKG